MGFFDFLGGGQAAPQPMDAVAGIPAGGANPMGGTDYTALLKDPNFIQFLAGVGAMANPGGPGEAIGAPVVNWSRNKAFQDAAAKQSSRDEAIMQQLIGLIGGAKNPAGVVGPVDDPKTFNSVTFDGKGMTIKAPLPGAEMAGIPTNAPLESVTKPVQSAAKPTQTQATAQGGRDFSPFFNRLVG